MINHATQWRSVLALQRHGNVLIDTPIMSLMTGDREGSIGPLHEASEPQGTRIRVDAATYTQRSRLTLHLMNFLRLLLTR